jgi:hypothetical protein
VSNGLAIAATTRVISSIIEDWVNAANITTLMPVPVISLLAPDMINTSSSETPHLNLFLYQVMRNQGWSPERFPARDSSGAQVDRPYLALDLHYALSAYGQSDSAHSLLGFGTQALHETPVLSRGRVQTILSGLNSPADVLTTSGLASQIEQIKITPLPMSLDDLSKLWMAFQAKFRPTACYAATVVLIESTKPVKSTLPVTSRNLVVLPFTPPSIDSIKPQIVAFAAGATIQLRGQSLLQPGMSAVFGNGQSASLATTPDPSRVGVTLPSLPAGVNTVRVVRYVDVGVPPQRVFTESNVAAFILQPVLQRKPGPSPQPYDITATTAASVTTFQLKVQPDAGPQQRVELLLNQLNPPPGAQLFYTIQAAPADITPGGNLTFRANAFQTGTYLVRVRVDGAESPLDLDASGKFTAPQVTV